MLHWYDFLCPFCYVGQHRTAILVRHGLEVVELPFQAHPDIPPGGIAAGPRDAPMYAMLELPLGRLGRAARALMRKFPPEEQSANLRRLKEIMETGRVTDTSYSVLGKFARP